MDKLILRSIDKVDIRGMFNRMKCRSCDRFPSPYYRFICEDSHLLCAYCVNTKFEINGEICSVNLEDRRKRVAGGSNKGAEPKSVAICQKLVARCPADPVYCAFFNQSMWKCPGTVNPEEDDDPCAGGCTACLKGENLFLHLQTEHGQPNQQNKKRKFCNDWDYASGPYEMHIEKRLKSGVNGIQ